jgi:hypothetical protein
VPQPVVTDPGFAFQDFWSPFVTIEPPYFGAFPGPFGYSNTNFINGGYLFSWSAVDGQLTAIRIDFNAENDDVHLGLTGGLIGSDGVIGTCEEGVCGVLGYWQNVSVPEPGSAALLLSLLFGVGLVRHRRLTGMG